MMIIGHHMLKQKGTDNMSEKTWYTSFPPATLLNADLEIRCLDVTYCPKMVATDDLEPSIVTREFVWGGTLTKINDTYTWVITHPSSVKMHIPVKTDNLGALSIETSTPNERITETVVVMGYRLHTHSAIIIHTPRYELLAYDKDADVYQSIYKSDSLNDIEALVSGLRDEYKNLPVANEDGSEPDWYCITDTESDDLLIRPYSKG